MSHDHEGVDLLALYSKANSSEWNKFLTLSLKNEDLNGLGLMRRRIQIGMNNLVKQRLDSPKMNEFFLRLQRSIENTAKQVLRRKHPSPLDSPDSAKKLQIDDTKAFLKHHAAKKKRDQEFERFLRDASF